jgi:hypothetical protein
VTGQLQLAGGDNVSVCVHCGVRAVGPCARCHVPLCGDCCVVTEEGAKPWAICRDCDAGGAGALRSGWWTVALWVGGPMLALLVAVLLMSWLAG